MPRLNPHLVKECDAYNTLFSLIKHDEASFFSTIAYLYQEGYVGSLGIPTSILPKHLLKHYNVGESHISSLSTLCGLANLMLITAVNPNC